MNRFSRSKGADFAGLLVFAMLAGCGPNAAVTDDETAAFDEAGAELRALTSAELSGDLSPGATATIHHPGTPRYRAYRFTAGAGSEVDLWVRSSTGDATAWLLASNFRTLATNDDAAPSVTDSHLHRQLASGGTYYVAFREKQGRAADFSVSLAFAPVGGGAGGGAGSGSGGGAGGGSGGGSAGTGSDAVFAAFNARTDHTTSFFARYDTYRLAVTDLTQSVADGWTEIGAVMIGNGHALQIAWCYQYDLGPTPYLVPVARTTNSDGSCRELNAATMPDRNGTVFVNFVRWSGAFSTTQVCAVGGTVSVVLENTTPLRMKLTLNVQFSDGTIWLDRVVYAPYRQ